MLSTIVGIRNLILKIFYKGVMKPFIFLMKPEKAHDVFKAVGVKLGTNPVTLFITKLLFSYHHKMLNTTVDGVFYESPVGLSAGFDKDGELTKIYPRLGFGLAELGSFTGEVCPGNPGAGNRLFRLKKSKSILVWYGLNNQGSEKISKRLRNVDFGKLRVGISAAKSNLTPCFVLEQSVADYVKTMQAFKDVGDYYTLNISCPNTQDGEPFVIKKNLDALLTAANENRVEGKPIYVKLAADMSIDEVNAIVDGVMEHGIDGVVLTNLAKPAFNDEYIKEELTFHKGGLSGLPLQRISTDVIRHVYRRTRGQITIIGVGGIFTAQDAFEKITSGANLVHLITAMIFDGPQSVSEINRGLVKLLKKNGYSSIEEAVGVNNPLPTEEEMAQQELAMKERMRSRQPETI
ncbi:MAG: dihydroorotate dehydrogenase (quinone) [Gammaproteobacteria bacterium]|nr:MAG: dihydroorotate dehydrogenase (quinone) [Gammaproteobacteria bacterium]